MSEEPIDPQSIRAGTPDWQEGYSEGKKYARNKVHDLFFEVIEAYESMIIDGETEDARRENEIIRCQINAVKFTQKWTASGGATDIDGNRACFPW